MTEVRGPRSITSQVITFYTNMRLQSGLRDCKAASRAVQKLYNPPSEGVQKLYAHGLCVKRYDM